MQNKIKILIVRLSSLGDIIHTYPMIFDIKNNLPNASIDWLVDDSFKSLVALNPHVDNIIPIPLRKWKKNKLKLLSNINVWKKEINNNTYDYIIDSQGLVKSALLSKCFNGKIYGLGIRSIREKIASLFYDKTFETGKELLAITKNRILASYIFNYRIDLASPNFGLNSYPSPEIELDLTKKYIIFFHATSKDSKKYPPNKWAELGTYLIAKENVSIVLPYGSLVEKNEALSIQKLLNVKNVLVPERIFNYSELTGLVSNASFVFGVDTGLIHLANALNKKLIAIYIDTDPKKTGIFESLVAKNIGGKNSMPEVEDLIKLYESIEKA